MKGGSEHIVWGRGLEYDGCGRGERRQGREIRCGGCRKVCT